MNAIESAQRRVLRSNTHLCDLMKRHCPIGTPVEGTDGKGNEFETKTKSVATVGWDGQVVIDLGNRQTKYPCARLTFNPPARTDNIKVPSAPASVPTTPGKTADKPADAASDSAPPLALPLEEVEPGTDLHG